MRVFFLLFWLLISINVFGQYNMSDMTVTDCEGTLKDSEANAVNSTYYTNGENYSFTICPPNAVSLVITFTEFHTEPINDYLRIFNGPDTNSPLVGGPFSGISMPPQIITSGCITINFISDINVTTEGFELNWEAQIIPPQAPNLNILNPPTCSTNVIVLDLDQNIHCDSVYTAQITVGGQLNQNIIVSPLNCINDSTNTIQLNLSPGLNESGVYDVFFQTSFRDLCDSVWLLSSTYQVIIDDCPLLVDLSVYNDSICLGDCVDLYTSVSGGDGIYTYTWDPSWNNSAGPWTVCPTSTTTYIVTVDDTGPASSQSDTITIVVSTPPVTQQDFDICNTASPVGLTANPSGGWWYAPSIINGTNPLFNPQSLAPGVYTVNYEIGGCSDDLDITVLEVNAGPDISACLNAPMFNLLDTSLTTPGGTWSSTWAGLQSNGDILVGGSPTTITAVYTLQNGCVDTLLVDVGGLSTQPDDTICQNSGNYSMIFSPTNGFWSVAIDTVQQISSCATSIFKLPYKQSFEFGLGNWIHDPSNDFDWVVNSGGTPSAGTGPSNAFEGDDYIYTEASSPNFPSKTSSIISPCLNLSAYFNPVLYFWYHKQGVGQGSFAIDISIDDGLTWSWNHWYIQGDIGSVWQEAAIDLSMFNTTEVRIRLRVITGDGSNGPGWQSDVAVDKLSILGGPITLDGQFLSNIADSGVYNLIYAIPGCEDYVDIYVNEINAGEDIVACPTQPAFNLLGSPSGGVWNGPNITNINQGTFDPSLGAGYHFISYDFNGCVDTTEIWVIDTEIQIDTLFFCVNSGMQILDGNIAPCIPWNGIWSGLGVSHLNNSIGEFRPNIAGEGTHVLTYTANDCSDDLIVIVYPSSVLLDTLICSSSPDFILNVIPPGGDWVGNGVSNIGLISPTQLGVGIHQVGYLSPNGCVDTFEIEIYTSAILTMDSIDNYYCFIDSNIQIYVSPSGGMLSGNGIVGQSFNPSVAGSGYHVISYSLGTGICEQVIDTIVFVDQELIGTTYQSDDTTCVGDIIKIGVNANGGLGGYSFLWDNGLSTSFEHLVEPVTTTNYLVAISDGCSDDFIDTINIFVQPTFTIDFDASFKKCYGEDGYAKVIPSPLGDYSYSWNTVPEQTEDSIIALVNRDYEVNILNNYTKCSIRDTVRIPGYDILKASFFSHESECLSLVDAEIQFIDNSNINPDELSQSGSFWDLGNTDVLPYIYGVNPSYTYTDTGQFTVVLYLMNDGGCIDSNSINICVTPSYKMFIPNSFTPDSDNCNDEFFVKGVGAFFSFEISIFGRWGSESVFESNEIIFSENVDDNLCDGILSNETYYRMGTWDGMLRNGNPSPLGVYTYIIRYKSLESDDLKERKGTISLLR